jgi:hypothetical protein
MLVYVRPSNEALLRARVPGAQDQRGCPSSPLHRVRSNFYFEGGLDGHPLCATFLPTHWHAETCH